jgi:hypothetical protein
LSSPSSTNDLTNATAELGKTYKLWKSAEKAKDDRKKEFFAAATKAVEGEIGEMVVDVEAADEAALISFIEKQYPAHEMEDFRPNQEKTGWYEVILIERPDLKPFTFVNEEDGMVYQRQVTQGSPMLDDERLETENPDLYKRVTEVVGFDYMKEIAYEAGVHQRELDSWFDNFFDHFPPTRKLRDLGTLDPETLAELQDYIYMSKPVVKLAAPRKAKEEDYE